MTKIFFAVMLSALSAHAKLVTKIVEYKDGNTVLEGYLAYDDSKGIKPGVLVVHDWMGLGEDTKKRTELLAGLGYVAFAADIYGKGVRPKDSAEAGKLATQYKSDIKILRGRVSAAFNLLKAQTIVNPSKLAAIGYCFGGTTVLELARSGISLAGVVSFHGGLATP